MTQFRTGTGRSIDLLALTPADIEWPQVAACLGKGCRFGGHIGSGIACGLHYSIAQHSVIGARHAEEILGRFDVARAFLLHDAHEYLISDITTPAAEALGQHLARAVGPGLDGVRLMRVAIKGLKDSIDRAIYTAAGVAWPLTDEVAAHVKDIDARLLAREQMMLRKVPERELRTPPLVVRGWPAPKDWRSAADEWLAALHRLFPEISARSAA